MTRTTTPMPPSLTQRGAVTLQCPSCTSERVTEIAMQLTDGTVVDFLSCRACEHRSWRDGDRLLALPEVLGRSRKAS